MAERTADLKPIPLFTPLVAWLEEKAAGIRNETLVLIPTAFVLGAVGASLIFWALGAFDIRWLPDASERMLSFFGWADGFFQNFGTEMVGAVITILLLEVMLDRRREYEAEQREKERLILQMGSPFNESAVEAARQLTARGWLTDGSLQGARLLGADLRGAILTRVNLRGAKMWGAQLQEAHLTKADLQETDLRGANLTKATLLGANLQGAILTRVNLRGATATVEQLRGAKTLEGSTLPDGRHLRSYEPWREAFDLWAEKVATDDRGIILTLASLGDDE